MKSIENFDVQELDSKALVETNGGCILGLIIIGIAIGYFIDVANGDNS